ncbi:MAG: hypothetical protein SAK29_15925 [Scytonema sp. PMC 1069.18]|nr:hypothetical protein [Scytonema sp. PMC 1069.18]MEC4882979.1 hypothetical protein [Scytonema sp. PMC 1070.18]
MNAVKTSEKSDMDLMNDQQIKREEDRAQARCPHLDRNRLHPNILA